MAYSKHPLAQAAMSKSAGVLPTWKDVKTTFRENPMLVASTAATGVGMGLSGLSAAASKLKDMYDRHSTYKQMLELNPVLRDSDPTMTKRYFNSLHKINPHFMGDPLIAGALVHRVIENQNDFGGVGRPSTALAAMAGELAQGRASMSKAISDESRRGGFIQDSLNPLIRETATAIGQNMMNASPAAMLRAENKKEHENLTKLRDQIRAENTANRLREQQTRERLLGLGKKLQEAFRPQSARERKAVAAVVTSPRARERVREVARNLDETFQMAGISPGQAAGNAQP